MVKKYIIKRNKAEGNYRFGTGLEFIDMNVLSGPDIERAINGRALQNEEDDDVIE